MYLNCHSYYSLRYGTLSLEKLVALAKHYQIEALALTDINNSTAILEFVKLCKENKIKPIAGIEFRNNNQKCYVGIAKNNKGFLELNQMLSELNFSQEKIPQFPKFYENVLFIYPYGNQPKQLNSNEFVGVGFNDLNKLLSIVKNIDQKKIIISQPITFENDYDFFIHKNLRAIDNNILISQINLEHIASYNEVFQPLSKIIEAFNQFPIIIKNTEHLIESCNIDFNFHSPKNKKVFTKSHAEDKELLENLALQGLEYRYGKNNSEALRRIKHEIEVIHKLGFSAYFLIAWDIINYSLSKGYYHVGRGSGANSIVAYCLKITDVDPIELDLYFERFINEKRTSPPDFDIDYSWKDRDDVQKYIFKKYTKRHTALLGAMSTFKDKSTYRELGKVYGLPKQEIDDLVANPEDKLNLNDITIKIIQLRQRILDFPNIRSIHAGGIIISEDPICCYTALDMPPKGFPTTQWDMYIAEEFGFEKFDILSQRGIGHIKDCAQLILENKGQNIDVHQVDQFKKDTSVKAQLKRAETIGCFYIESPAMRGLLTKLRCDNYLSLVAASSIIRPGVAKSGMMKEYIFRFHNPDKFKYLHPVMEEQLKETYGVMVYQEDVIKVCHHFAGLDLADADVLRRAMSGKSRARKEFERLVEKFFNNCKNFGYSDEITKEVWRQIESFAGYSFSKAHSASYAVESFQSLYLKAYFPLEFMVAVINNFGGFYKTWVYFNEAKRCGGNIELPCVNNGKYLTHLIENCIYIGFIHISNLEEKLGNLIVNERNENGLYISLESFIERTQISIEQLILLIKIGAFRFTGKSKAILLWEAHMFVNKKPSVADNYSLFSLPTKKFQLPKLVHLPIEDAYDELELLGFAVTHSFFELADGNNLPNFKAKDLYDNEHKVINIVGHLVNIKYVRTVKKDWMHFGTFLDSDGFFFDTVHFAQSLQRYPFRGDGLYLINGKVIKEFDYPSIQVEKMAKIPLKKDPRNA